MSSLTTCLLYTLFDFTFQKKFNTNIEHIKYMLAVSKAATELFLRSNTVHIQLGAVKFSSAFLLHCPQPCPPTPQLQGSATAQPECDFELQL